MGGPLTLADLIEDLERSLEGLPVSDKIWTTARSFVLLEQLAEQPGVLSPELESMGISVTVPETVNPDRLGSSAEIWVDDTVVVTLFYRLPPGPSLRRARTEALRREDELRRAVTSQGATTPHARRLYLGSRRTIDPSRTWLVIALRFKFDRRDDIGGT